jgi:DNA glycosylase AlkZ-like
MMQRISVRERRARLGLRHRLAAGALAGDPVEVARSLVAVHSTDPSSVYLTLPARMTRGDIGCVDRALYQDRTLIRLLGMRRTVFVTALDIAPLIQAACSRAVAANERRKLASTAPSCSTGPATSARPCGGTAGSSAAGPRTATGRSSAGSSKTPGPTPSPRWMPPPGGWLPPSAASGSPPAPAE